MEGSALLYVLLLTVIPVVLALLIALPFIAHSSGPVRSGAEEYLTVQGDIAQAETAQRVVDPGARRN